MKKRCSNSNLKTNVFLRENPMSYLERQNAKNKKMTNKNQKSQKQKNHIKIKFKIRSILQEKYMFYHERQNLKYGKMIKKIKGKNELKIKSFFENPSPWLKAPAGAFFIDKKYSYEESQFLKKMIKHGQKRCGIKFCIDPLC